MRGHSQAEFVSLNGSIEKRHKPCVTIIPSSFLLAARLNFSRLVPTLALECDGPCCKLFKLLI